MYKMWVYLPYCKFIISLSSVLQLTSDKETEIGLLENEYS